MLSHFSPPVTHLYQGKRDEEGGGGGGGGGGREREGVRRGG